MNAINEYIDKMDYNSIFWELKDFTFSENMKKEVKQGLSEGCSLILKKIESGVDFFDTSIFDVEKLIRKEVFEGWNGRVIYYIQNSLYSICCHIINNTNNNYRIGTPNNWLFGSAEIKKI